MTVTIPDQCVPGKLRLVTNNGETIVSASNITFVEEIKVSSMSPDPVHPGDVLTIKGEYVWNIGQVVFFDHVTVNAEDFDFSRGATDRIGIEYHGDDLSIGCGGNRLLSILSKLVEPTVTIGLMDPSRPILFDDKEGDAEITMLLMPMLIN